MTLKILLSIYSPLDIAEIKMYLVVFSVVIVIVSPISAESTRIMLVPDCGSSSV
jgi:hypothetical protein|nr:MAG TPA: hypothetical protein [Caudoviricetes sp.]